MPKEGCFQLSLMLLLRAHLVLTSAFFSTATKLSYLPSIIGYVHFLFLSKDVVYMSTTDHAIPISETRNNSHFKWLMLVFLVYLILLAVSTIGTGFRLATGEQAETLFEFASHPVAGLVIGMVCTALIQSSSTVSSIIVALVAGGLPIGIAVPMIMGANIGTSITNTLVSLGHIRSKEEFRRAFSAATIHDFFNIISVCIFLPLEIAFNFLEKTAAYLLAFLGNDLSVENTGFNFIKAATKPLVEMFSNGFSFLPEVGQGVALAILGILLIVLSISMIGQIMRSLMVGKAKNILHSAIGRGPMRGIASGTVVTVLVQSSSTTTSLVVPLVGTGVLTNRDIYPFTLGANIGTCITALIAALAVTGENALLALEIALVHLLYNFLGVMIIYGIAQLRELPLTLSERLAMVVAEKKIIGLLYIGTVFFLIPLLAIALTN